MIYNMFTGLYIRLNFDTLFPKKEIGCQKEFCGQNSIKRELDRKTQDDELEREQ